MLIYFDGPEKAGKSTLAKSTASRFEEDAVEIWKWTGPDNDTGFGYLRPFIAALDATHPTCGIQVHIFDRGWVSEHVYGKLLGEPRQFVFDPFLCEWLYGRALIGRGGKFIVLPEDVTDLEVRRDETDLEVDPLDETLEYGSYAFKWGYTPLNNVYTKGNLAENTAEAARSVFIPTHTLHSTEYIGSLNPEIVFVGDTHQGFAFQHRPFFSRHDADWFRGFGPQAITEWGYASTKGFQRILDENHKNLLRGEVITVGPRAAYLFPDYPHAPYDMDSTDPEKINDFQRIVFGIQQGARYERA